MAPALSQSQPSAEQLVVAQRYARATVSRILRMVPDDIDDVLQDAALNVVRTKAFKGESAFNTYFKRCANQYRADAPPEAAGNGGINRHGDGDG